MAVLIDSNILLDLFTNDPLWCAWSQQQLNRLGKQTELVINPIIYAEIGYHFRRADLLNAKLEQAVIKRVNLSWPAAHLAAQTHRHYRERGGKRKATLPDFFIGAHAAVEK